MWARGKRGKKAAEIKSGEKKRKREEKEEGKRKLERDLQEQENKVETTVKCSST
jgi:hypothetical protein